MRKSQIYMEHSEGINMNDEYKNDEDKNPYSNRSNNPEGLLES